MGTLWPYQCITEISKPLCSACTFMTKLSENRYIYISRCRPLQFFDNLSAKLHTWASQFMHAKCWWPHTRTGDAIFQTTERHIFYANGKSLCHQIMRHRSDTAQNIDTSDVCVCVGMKNWCGRRNSAQTIFSVPIEFQMSARMREASFFMPISTILTYVSSGFALPVSVVATLSSRNLSWIRIKIKYQFHCTVKRFHCHRIISIEFHFLVMLVTSVD